MSWHCTSRKRSPWSFFDSLRIVVWQFLYYSKDVGDLPPNFDNCPSYCPDSKERLFSLCATCPKRELSDGFREACEGYLNERIGEGWKRYGFNTLHRTVLDTLDLDRNGGELTTTASRCVAILQSERDKMRRIDEWNQRQKTKQ